MSRRAREIAIGECAARQSGAVTTRQLRALGLSASSIARKSARGEFVRLLPGVYAVVAPGASPSINAHRAAAVLASTPPAALGMRTAFDLHGIWTRRPRRSEPELEVHVLVPARLRDLPQAPWVVHHRAIDLTPREFTVIDDLLCANLARAICDGGRFLTPYQLASIILKAEFEHGLPRAEIDAIVDRRKRHPGVAIVRHALRLHDADSAGTRSWSEDHMLEGLLAAPIPIPIVNTRGITGLPGYEADFVWLHAKLILEVDGGGHDLLAERQQDEERDSWHHARGWRIIRCSTDEVWERRDAIVAAIIDALTARGHESSAIRY